MTKKEWRLKHSNNCIDCGKKLSTPNAKRCKQCSNIHLRSKDKRRICEECGKEFEVYPCRQRRFCSKECFEKWMVRTHAILCDHGILGKSKCTLCNNNKSKEWLKDNPSFCIDCGASIFHGSTRCNSCSLINQWKTPEIRRKRLEGIRKKKEITELKDGEKIEGFFS